MRSIHETNKHDKLSALLGLVDRPLSLKGQGLYLLLVLMTGGDTEMALPTLDELRGVATDGSHSIRTTVRELLVAELLERRQDGQVLRTFLVLTPQLRRFISEW